MPQPDLKVYLATLVERTSSKGNKYWTAHIGSARLIAFNTSTPQKEPAIRVFVVPGHFNMSDAADA